MNEILVVLAAGIDIREKSKATYRESQNYSKMVAERELTTANVLLVSGERKRCAYCLKDNQSSEECGKVISTKERKDILKRYGKCYICSKRVHRGRDYRAGVEKNEMQEMPRRISC